nr:hypothetical protein Iba_chr09aCG9520 [Ipomoea batatas]
MGCNSRTIRKYHRMNIESEIQRTVRIKLKKIKWVQMVRIKLIVSMEIVSLNKTTVQQKWIEYAVICRRIITPICIQKPRCCYLEHRKEVSEEKTALGFPNRNLTSHSHLLSTRISLAKRVRVLSRSRERVIHRFE